MAVPTTIEFGTDGWRAIIAEDFTFENVRICAQAVAEYLHERDLASRGLVVGYDTRFASERFAAAVVGQPFTAVLAGFLAQRLGVVVDAGDVFAGVDGRVMPGHEPA